MELPPSLIEKYNRIFLSAFIPVWRDFSLIISIVFSARNLLVTFIATIFGKDSKRELVQKHIFLIFVILSGIITGLISNQRFFLTYKQSLGLAALSLSMWISTIIIWKLFNQPIKR